MKQLNLLKVVMLSAVGIVGGSFVAQAQGPISDNIAGNVTEARFVVNSPSSIGGLKKVTIATWAATPLPPYLNYDVVKAYDTLASATLLNGTGSYPSLAGKFALIFRGGGVAFVDKATRAQAAGAAGVIIVNNVPGDPVGMGGTASLTIPVVMVSDVDGMAINNQLKASATVTISLGKWALGASHDLGLVTAYQNAPHALNIPLSQMAGSATTNAYKHYVGGAVANYGTSTETGITVVDSVYWVPTSGAPTYLTANSYTVSSIAPTDSIKFGFGTSAYSLTPATTTGRYEHRYTLSYANTDGFPQDNVHTMTQYVTDSILCKGTYDYTNKRPHVSIGIQPASAANPFMMGTLYFIKNGKYAAKTLQYSLSKNTFPTLDGETVLTYLYKWVDGSGGQPLDKFAQAGEMTLVGFTSNSFTTADSSGEVINAEIKDPSGTGTVVLEDNTWYWTAVECPSTCFIGMDRAISYYTRSFSQFLVGGSVAGGGIDDNAELAVYTDRSTLEGDPANTPWSFPFSVTAAYGSVYFVDSIFYDRYNEIPATALILSTTPVSIKDVQPTSGIGSVELYPNPASTSATVDVNLDKTSSRVIYKLIDAVGRTVYTETHRDVKNEQFTLNTANYASGTYYLFVVTDNGTTSRKITVQK